MATHAYPLPRATQARAPIARRTQVRVVTVERPDRAWRALAALLILTAAIGCSTLFRMPVPDVDEAWNANRAWALLQTGRAFGSMDAGVFERYEGYWTFMPWLGTALHVPAVWLLGPTLAAMRATSLLFGLLLLVAVYAIGVQLGGARLGLLAALLLSLSRAFVESSHLGRHDVIVAAMGFGAIALVVTKDEGRRTKDEARTGGWPGASSALAGLLVGLSIDVHLNGVIFGPVLLALLWHGHGWSMAALLRSHRLWGLVAGAALGVGWFVWRHLLPYPETYFALGALGPAAVRVPPLATLDVRVWLRSLAETGELLVLASPFVVPLACLALRGAAPRAWSTARPANGCGAESSVDLALPRRPLVAGGGLLVLAAALSFAFAAAVRTKLYFYAILVAPATALLAGAFLDAMIDALAAARVQRHVPRGAFVLRAGFALAVAGLVVASTAHAFQPGLQDPKNDFSRTLEQVRRLIPPGSSVLGPQTYWFGLSADQRYLSWEQILYFQKATPGSTVEDALATLRPDFVVIDSRLAGFVVDDVEELPERFRHLYVNRTGLAGTLRAHGRRVGEITTGTFGTVTVYHMQWA